MPLIYDNAEYFKDGLAIVEKEKKYELLKISCVQNKADPISPQTGDKNITIYVILAICAIIFMTKTGEISKYEV